MLENLVYGDCAKNVIYHVKNFHMNVISQQPHMQTVTQIAEYMVYTNYKPHLLKDDVFPIPPPGYEYFEMKVHAMIESNNDEEVDPDGIEKMGYEVSNWKPELNDILVCRNIVDNILLENEPLNNERIGKLLNIDHSLLNNIDKMITVSEPCNLCCWRKDRNPSIVVVCSGTEELCKFKYEFFAKWPEYLLSEINKTQMLLDCDTLEKYAQLMDILFSVKYIERAFELKAEIDNTMLSLHPYMCYPVTWYNALLYRYYCSPWVTPKGLHLEEEEEMENVEDVIPVSSDEGFESD